MKTKTLLLALLTFCSVNLISQIIHVPADQPTIQDGINAAENGDTVLVENGTYYENIKFFGKAITVASQFLINGSTSHINGTKIDGSVTTQSDSASTVMFIHAEDSTSILSGFTIQGGSGTLNSSENMKIGGGIFCFESGPKISNCRIKDNVISHPSFKCGGAGIACIANTGDHWLVVENCTITDNLLAANAISAFGAGIYSEINSIVRNNTIADNNCFNISFKTEGGGIAVKKFADNDVFVHIYNNIIEDNLSHGVNAYGGAIAVFHALVSIEGNEILNNKAIAEGDADGGGIYLGNTQDGAVINDNIIDGNVAEGDWAWGGGLETVFAGELNISNNQFTNNSCNGTTTYGGAMNLSGPTGRLFIIGNEIRQNYLTGIDYWFGAGIWIDTYSDQVIIRSNLIKDNGGNEVDIWSLGGGVAIFTASGNEEVIIDKNIFRQNYAQVGGGLWTYNTFNNEITNNVFFWNESEENGGAINFRENTGKGNVPFIVRPKSYSSKNIQKSFEGYHPAIINNAFFGNTAIDYGGAIYSDHLSQVPVILNSVFLINDAPYGKDIINVGDSSMVVAYSIIDTMQINSPWIGDGNLNANPGLVDDSCHISGSSPCINAGAMSVNYFGQTFLCPDEDIDGQPRPLNTAPEIGVDEVLATIHEEFLFGTDGQESQIHCYPNPFSENTTIEYHLTKSGYVSIEIFNLAGNLIETLFSGNQSAGKHEFNWNSSGMKTGLYLIKVIAPGKTCTQKVQKIK